MSQLENTSDMMAQLNASFGSTITHSSRADTALHPAHARRKTLSEDLSILAHAQDQLQSHLAAAPMQAYAPIQFSDSTWQSHSQSQPPYLSPDRPAHPLRQHARQHAHQHQHRHEHHHPRPRSSHQFPTTMTHSDLRSPVTTLPLRWWENGVLVSNSSSDEDDIRPSIERDPAGSVVPSIEMRDAISPGTNVKVEEEKGGLDGEEVQEPQPWDETQSWNGYVKHKESWVRRAGLKREREEDERNGAEKRGRA